MKKSDIEQIIDHLKEIKKVSDIQNYTVSTTTLEDVFLKVMEASHDF